MERITKLPKSLLSLGASLDSDFKTIKDATLKIRQKLQGHADGKLLKGEEITAWIGEIYGKIILNGELMPEKYEYDVKTQDKLVAVKARKGASWQISSAIPRIKGDECPTHLMFMRFADDYSLLSVWLFPWEYLRDNNRFIKKKVRGEDRGYYVRIRPSIDKDYLIYLQESARI